MVQLEEIKHGENNWDTPLNANLSKLNIGKADTITDTGWVACATLLNGAQVYSTMPGVDTNPLPEAPDRGDTTIKRRVINYGTFKMVTIIGAIGFTRTTVETDASTDVPYHKAVIKLPSGYPLDGYQEIPTMNGSHSSTVRWTISTDATELTISFVQWNADVPDGPVWFPINFTYFSK